MEMVLNNGFCMLSQQEMDLVDGGGFFEDAWNGACKAVTAAASGAVVGAKVGAVTSNPVGILAGAAVGGVVNVAWDYFMK
ncbi:Blp family class II bacteriocin [Anaerocolumna sp.]|uniref:Blp family class II bacteriocin n=1 Tax=Anaerocolumna sp. TaxID=2041569 RepID=UPI0028AB8ED8|nr:Blp family class II bacteriocin [Anaerocolumna sp.]